jgi:exonuclease SbcC
MDLISAQYNNIFTFKDLFFDFRLINFALFKGLNGTGKSFFFDALCWVLFGITPRKKYKSIIRDIPEKQKSGFGIIELLEDDGTVYKIKRIVGKGKGLKLFKNDKEIKFRLSSLVQDEIIKIIGMNFKTFLNVSYFSQGDIGKFLISDSGERINIISDIFELMSFDLAKKSVGADLRNFELKLQSFRSKLIVYKNTIKNIDLVKLSKLKKMSEVALDKANSEISKINYELNSIKEKIELKNKLDYLRKDYSNLRERKVELFNDYKNNIRKMDLRIDSIELLKSKIKILLKSNSESNDIKDEIELVKKEIDKINNILTKNETEKEIVKKEIILLTDIIKMKGSRCKYCRTVIDERNVEYVNAQLEKNKNKFESLNNRINKYLDLLDIRERRLYKLKSDFKKFDSIIANIEKYKLKIKNAHYAIFEKVEYVKDYKIKKNVLIDKIKGIRNGMNKLKSDLKYYVDYDEDKINEVELRWKKNEQMIYNIESKLNVIKYKINEHNNAYKKVKRIEDKISLYDNKFNMLRWWYDNFPKIKLEMINEIIPFIEAENNKILSEILPGKFMKFLLDTDKVNNKLEMIIKDYNTGVERIFEGWSGGQRDRMALATYFALNKIISMRNNKKFNFLILDEKFVGVDYESRSAIFSMLRKENKYRKIFVISHIENIENEFNEIVNVTNKNGVSNFEIKKNRNAISKAA